MRLTKTEDGYALMVAGKRVYEVYVPDWSAQGEAAVVFPFGPISLVIEWGGSEPPLADPWNVRVGLDVRKGQWSYEIGLNSRMTRLYREVPTWRDEEATS